MGTVDARGVPARKRGGENFGRLRLSAANTPQQYVGAENRPRSLRCIGAEPWPLRSFRWAGRLPLGKQGSAQKGLALLCRRGGLFLHAPDRCRSVWGP